MEVARNLKLAIQKGRLAEDTVGLLQSCDFKFSITDRVDKVQVRNFPLELLMMRNGDIPFALEEGYVDFAFIGGDKLDETSARVRRLMPVGFGSGIIQAIVPDNSAFRTMADIKAYSQRLKESGEDNRVAIATSYPNISTRFLDQEGIPFRIKHLDGSVELAATENWADVIVDIVSSGSSLDANRLRAIKEVASFEAELAAAPRNPFMVGSERIVFSFLQRLSACSLAKFYRLIEMNASTTDEQTIVAALPSRESPTVMPLSNGGVAIKSVVPAQGYWDKITELQDLGARDIIEVPLIRMVPNRNDRGMMKMMQSLYGERL